VFNATFNNISMTSRRSSWLWSYGSWIVIGAAVAVIVW